MMPNDFVYGHVKHYVAVKQQKVTRSFLSSGIEANMPLYIHFSLQQCRVKKQVDQKSN